MIYYVEPMNFSNIFSLYKTYTSKKNNNRLPVDSYVNKGFCAITSFSAMLSELSISNNGKTFLTFYMFSK